jgi:glucose/arabinose dehydrogenase
MPYLPLLTVLFLLSSAVSGCYALRSSAGGGETSFTPPRAVETRDIVVPQGYFVEIVATGLTFPTGVAFDDEGDVYVVEAGYSYGEVFTTPRLLKIEAQGKTSVIATGDKGGPWTGVTFLQGDFYVSEGRHLQGGRLLRISPQGRVAVIIEGLPSRGDHHNNGPVAGSDGWIYFGQGTATNSGVVGEDNVEFGWLPRFPDVHDIPCRDVTLAGRNFSTHDVLDPQSRKGVETGAFVPFGTATAEGQVIPGEVPCSGAVLRVRSEGGDVELVAWGLRNPFGLAFSPDGRLFAMDNSFDVRGSRPVFGTGDLLWEIVPGRWYGWPDFHGEHLMAEGRFRPPGREEPEPLLAVHPERPPRPAAVLAVHSSSNGFDFSRSEAFGHVNQAFIAQFGDMASGTGKVMAPVGFKVVRVDVERGVSQDFAVNGGKKNGPASRIGGGGFERPVAVRFDPSGESLYVVDFGVMLHDGEQPIPVEKTGALWRIRRNTPSPGDEQ